VVVVIIGILSAVVVFAVKGAGDKGGAAAVAADARTVRTAEEAYCAKAGQYATMDQLIGKTQADDGNTYRFMSEASTYNKVEPTNGKVNPPLGPCDGWRYDLTVTPAGSATATTRPGQPSNKDATCLDPAGQVQPEGWCVIPAKGQSSYLEVAETLVQLPSGKVLKSEYGSLGLYDPAADPNFAWTSVGQLFNPGGSFGGTYIGAMIPIFGTDSECGDVCGKVLVFFEDYTSNSPSRSAWKLVDPATPTLPPQSAWSEPSTQPPPYTNTSYGRGVRLRGGKILLSRDDNRQFELYDPKGHTFTPVRGNEGLANRAFPTVFALLQDGRVLVTEYVRPALMFDPALEFPFTNAPSSPRLFHDGRRNPATVLHDGSVLEFGTDPSTFAEGAEIYHPGLDGGSWETVDSCPAVACYVLGSLADGTVLANGSPDSIHRLQGKSRDMFLFDPLRKKWRQTGSVNNSGTPAGGVLLDGGTTGPVAAACGTNCGKFLASGQDSSLTNFANSYGSAELYTPPVCTKTNTC